jgi:hypothetical protein
VQQVDRHAKAVLNTRKVSSDGQPVLMQLQALKVARNSSFELRHAHEANTGKGGYWAENTRKM